MTRKTRKKISPKIEAELLAANRHMCCICHKEGRGVQIHHIDDDPSNNDPENLCVVCLLHHDMITGKPGLGKGFTKKELGIYKKEWEDRCKVEDTKKIVIKNFNLFVAQTPSLKDKIPLNDMVTDIASMATLDGLMQSVEASASQVYTSTGDESLAKTFKLFVLKQDDKSPE